MARYEKLCKWEITLKMRDGSTHGVEWSAARRDDVSADYRQLVEAWHNSSIVAYEGEEFAWAVAATDVVSIACTKVFL